MGCIASENCIHTIQFRDPSILGFCSLAWYPSIMIFGYNQASGVQAHCTAAKSIRTVCWLFSALFPFTFFIYCSKISCQRKNATVLLLFFFLAYFIYYLMIFTMQITMENNCFLVVVVDRISKFKPFSHE